MTFIIGISMAFTGCGSSDTKEGGGSEVTDVDTGEINNDMKVTLGGHFFSIPSPFETANLLKESGAGFDANIINSPDNASNYTSDFYKALNLGVYGADLGYITIYNNNSNELFPAGGPVGPPKIGG